MTRVNHSLIWAVSLLVMASGCAFTNRVAASDKVEHRHVYKHSKLKFSLQYSATLTAQEFPNGVTLTNNAMQAYDRINIHVTNTALGSYKHSVKGAAEDFKRFRSAKAGAILKGDGPEIYEKVANLRVDGHPAVKVLYDNGRGPDMSSSPAAGAPLPRVHGTCVYVEKDGEVWEIVSYAFFRQRDT